MPGERAALEQAADQEHLVVDREPEDDREQAAERDRVQIARAAEQRRVALEADDQHADRRADRDEVEEHRAEGEHRRAEDDQQHQERHQHQHQHQQREARGRRLVEVVEQHGRAADDRPRRVELACAVSLASLARGRPAARCCRGRTAPSRGMTITRAVLPPLAGVGREADVGLRLRLRALDRREHEVAGGSRSVRRRCRCAAARSCWLSFGLRTRTTPSSRRLDAAAELVAARRPRRRARRPARVRRRCRRAR